MKYSIFITRFFLIGLAICLLIFSPFILDVSLLPRFICLSLLVALSLFFIWRSQQVFDFKPDIVAGSYILYSLFCCLSFFWAINKQEALFEACKTNLFLFTFMISYFLFKKDKKYFVEGLQKLAVVLGCILSSLVIYQLVSLKKFDRESLYLVNGISGHKNLLSSFLFLNLFFLISAWFNLTKHWKSLAAIATVCILILLFFLKTKAVWLGLSAVLIVFTACFYFPVKAKRPGLGFVANLFLWLVAANLFFIFLLQPLIQKSVSVTLQKSENTLSLENERLVLWDKTYAIFKKDPLKGVGVGNWQINFPDATLNGLWRAEDLNYTFQRPHNDFLWILSETGLIGLNLFLIFIFSIVVYLSKVIRSFGEKNDEKINSTLLLAFIVGYFVISFFDFPKERIEHGIFIGVMLAWAYFQIKTELVLPTFKVIKLNRPVFIFIIVLLMTVLTTGVLRYKGEYYTKKMYDFKNSGQNGLAIASAKSALSFAYSMDPTSVPLAWYLGNAQTIVYQPGDKSHAFFKKAFTLAPYNRNVLSDLASSYALMGDLAMAKKYYREAGRISPRFDEPKLNLIAIYINEKNYKLAAACISTLYHNSERRSQYQKIITAFQ